MTNVIAKLEEPFVYDVFISYSSQDSLWVRKTLLPRLEEAELKVCIDYRDFTAGKAALHNMRDELKRSRHVLLVMTPAWMASSWASYEHILVSSQDPAGLRGRTIPVLRKRCDIPDDISMLTYVDFTRPSTMELAWRILFSALGVRRKEAVGDVMLLSRAAASAFHQQPFSGLKPVLFIGGFPGTELYGSSGHTVFPLPLRSLIDPAVKASFIRELGAARSDVVVGPPIVSISGGGIAQEAQAIYAILRDQYKYDTSPGSNNFIPVGWDWRKSIDASDTLHRIGQALNVLSPKRNQNVVVIAHSAGGLVLRAFLETNPQYASCLEQILALGVPWAGTLEALSAVVTGVSSSFLPSNFFSAKDGRTLMSRALAAYELFPSDPHLHLFFDRRGKPTTPLADQSWIETKQMVNLARKVRQPFPKEFGDVLRLTNVCGWGAATLTTASIDKKTNALRFTSDKEGGDGTVPIASSSWLQGAGVRTMYLPIGAYDTGDAPRFYGQLWDSPPLLQLFDEVIGNRRRGWFLCAAADGDDYGDYDRPVRVRISAAAADGSILPNLTVNLVVSGKKTKVPMIDGKRATVTIDRKLFKSRNMPDIYRCTVEFSWKGNPSKDQRSQTILVRTR